MSLNRPRLTGFSKSHAILIGIDDYPLINADLQTPANDARRFKEVLIEHQGFTEEDITLLPNAKKAELEALLARIRQSGALKDPHSDVEPFDIQANHCLLFYFAGHGMAGEWEPDPTLRKTESDGPSSAGYLLPSDAKPETARLNNESLLPMEAVFDALEALPCRHVLVILDCCFSGTFRRISKTRTSIGIGFRPMSQARFERYKSQKAWQVLTSTGPTETAADWMGVRGDPKALEEAHQSGMNSPFAKALLDALSGQSETDIKPRGKNLGDGVITSHELFLYLHNQVEQQTRHSAEFKPQNPDLFPMGPHTGGQFIFCDPKHPKNDPDFDKRKRKNPYKGLHLYQPWDHEWFFGRERDVNTLIDLLEESPFGSLLISGASGTGKSSLVRAGIMPLYLNPELAPKREKSLKAHTCFVLRPGKPPWSLQPLPLAPPPLDDEGKPILPPSIPLLSDGLRLFSSGRNLLFVDQLEELFTECTPEEQSTFSDIMIEFMEQIGEKRVGKILFSIRSDFEWQLEISRLGERLLDTQKLPYQFYRLLGLDTFQLREALVGPATLQAFEFQKLGKESLVDRIIKDIDYAPAALPLLSFTMSEFFRIIVGDEENPSLKKRLFTFDTYEQQLGGVAGALKGKLQRLYNNLPDEEHRKTMQELILRMVRLNDGGYSRRRLSVRNHRHELAFQDEAKHKRVVFILDLLEEELLLISGGSPEDASELGSESEEGAFVELIHDSLINSRPAIEWINEFGQETIALQRQLWEAVQEAHSPGPRAMNSNMVKAITQEDLQEKIGHMESLSAYWDNSPKLIQAVESLITCASSSPSSAVITSITQTLEEIEGMLSGEALKKFRLSKDRWLMTGRPESLDVFIASGHSTEILTALLETDTHWLNVWEQEFILESWKRRIQEITDLQKQLEETRLAKELAEEKTREAQKQLENTQVALKAAKKSADVLKSTILAGKEISNARFIQEQLIYTSEDMKERHGRNIRRGHYDSDLSPDRVKQYLETRHKKMDPPLQEKQALRIGKEWIPVEGLGMDMAPNSIMYVQLFLANAGFLSEKLQKQESFWGIFGYETLAGVRMFQEYIQSMERDSSIGVPDGEIGAKTWTHILKWTQAQKKSAINLFDDNSPTESYEHWIRFLQTFKASQVRQPSETQKQIQAFPKSSNTLPVQEWVTDPEQVHIIAIRRNEGTSIRIRENDDLIVLLFQGICYTFWGSTDPNASILERTDEAFITEGQHMFKLAWYQYHNENKVYRAFRPKDRGVLVYRDRNDDNALTKEDRQRGLEGPNKSMAINWSGIGRTNFSGGSIVLAGASYLNPFGEVVDCSRYAAKNSADLSPGKTRGAYNVFMDLITLMDAQEVYLTLIREEDLALAPEFPETYCSLVLEKLQIV